MYVKVLDDLDFWYLEDWEKWFWIRLLILACKLNNKVPADENFLRSKLGITTAKSLQDTLKKFISKNFITLSEEIVATSTDSNSINFIDKLYTNPIQKVLEKKRRRRGEEEYTPVSAGSKLEKATEKETTKPYLIKTDDLSQVVHSYKQAQGFPTDDRNWDKQNWSRVSKSAKLLLAGMGTKDLAILCIQELSAEFKAKGLTWTLQGAILNNSSAWLIAYKKRDKDRITLQKQQMENLCIKCQLSPKVSDGLCSDCWDEEHKTV